MALRIMPIRIIGCGNFDRGDDAAGLLVARRLRAFVVEHLGVEIPGLEITEQSGESFSLMDCWTGFEQVVLVDATAPHGTPGQVRVWNAHTDRLSEDVFPCSTHAFGLREAVELGQVMKRLPQTLLIYGIEGKRFFLGAPRSPEVERAVVSVAERLMRRVSASLFQTPQRLPREIIG
ncbi:MAG: hydrogenase maturation protease [Candidatus Sulfotelmatobacter sp.]